MEILLGPAGSPASSTLEGIYKVKKLGLHTTEVQFVRGVKMKNALAKQIGKTAKQQNIKLSVHAPYYINLASKEKIKQIQSKRRILDSCERAHHLGAKHVIFHPAFFTDLDKDKVAQIVEEHVKDIKALLKRKAWNVNLAPETTGKHSQYGSLDELIKLTKTTGCQMCIDFAHIYARNNGKIDYKKILKKANSPHIHSHFSGINFTEKGERNHEVMGKPDFIPLAKEIIRRKQNITIISESPITWKDSLKQKKIFEKLGYKFQPLINN